MTQKAITKEQYILAAHQIIRRDGLPALTIRRLGRDLECNAANLYRYFESLEELSMYAALIYLRSYLKEVGQILQREQDCIAQYYIVWDCFCKHAFTSAPFFDLLFFRRYHQRLYIVMRDYYSLFPEEIKELGEQRAAFLQGDFDYRDYLMLDECVRQNRIDEDDAIMLNRISNSLFKGHFKKVLDLELGAAEQEAVRRKFLDEICFVFSPHIKKV